MEAESEKQEESKLEMVEELGGEELSAGLGEDSGESMSVGASWSCFIYACEDGSQCQCIASVSYASAMQLLGVHALAFFVSFLTFPDPKMKLHIPQTVLAQGGCHLRSESLVLFAALCLPYGPHLPLGPLWTPKAWTPWPVGEALLPPSPHGRQSVLRGQMPIMITS